MTTSVTTTDSVITEEMRAAVGRESAPWPVEVERGAVRAFARVIGEDDLVYYDLEVAQAAGYPDLPCPAGFLGRPVYIPGKSDTTFSGPPTVDFPFGDFTNVLNGGMTLRLARRIFAGERLTSTTAIDSVEERDGRVGRMLIVKTVTRYRDERGETVGETIDTEIRYR